MNENKKEILHCSICGEKLKEEEIDDELLCEQCWMELTYVPEVILSKLQDREF